MSSEAPKSPDPSPAPAENAVAGNAIPKTEATTPSQATIPPRKPRRRRWFLWTVLTLFIFLIILLIAIQIVLGTDIPRKIIVAQVQNELGLRMTAKSLSTGWTGRTQLDDVTLALPLAADSFVQVKSLRVRHSWLPWIVATQSVDIESIELDSPHVIVLQDKSGRWNLQEVIELLGRTGGAKSASNQPTPKAASMKLPRVTVSDATLDIVDNAGRHTSVGPIRVQGEPQGALAWKYDVVAPSDASGQPRVHVFGQVAPGTVWKHQLEFAINNIGPWVKPWVANWPDPAEINGKWEGELAGNGVAGRLELADLTVAHIRATGTVTAQTSATGATAQPENLTIYTGQKTLPDFKVISGNLKLEGNDVSVERMRLAVAGGTVEMNAHTSLVEQSGTLNASWESVRIIEAINQSGSITASVANRWPGKPDVHVDLHTRGWTEAGQWDATLAIQGGGESWDAMDLNIIAPSLAWVGKRRRISADGLATSLNVSRERVTLNSISVPNHELVAARGAYDIERDAWWLYSDGREVQLPGKSNHTASFNFNGWGTSKRLTLQQLYASTGEFCLQLQGDYDLSRPEPISAHLFAWITPSQEKLDEDELIVKGKLRSDAEMGGTLSPLSVKVAGHVYGDNLFIQDRELGDVIVDINEGFIESDRAWIKTDELEILGGRGQMTIAYPYSGKSVGVDVIMKDLPLAEMGRLAKVKGVHGMLASEFHLEIPSFRKNRITLTGESNLRDVRFQSFAADTIRIPMSLDRGRFKADAEAHSRDGGKADASAKLDIHKPSLVSTTLALKDWNIDLPDASAVLNGSIQADVDLADFKPENATANAAIELSSAFTLKGLDFGVATLKAQVKRRTLILDTMHADALGGSIDGSGTIYYDDPENSTASFAWDSVDPAKLQRVFPELAGLEGTYAGSLFIGPASRGRAYEPVQIDFTLNPSGDARYRTVLIGPMQLSLFAKLPKFGAHPEPSRLVIGEREYNIVHIAGGLVHPWARLTRHTGDNFSTHLTLEFEDLDVDQLIHVAKSDYPPSPGRIKGTVIASGNPRQLDRLSGDVRAQVSKSDLGNIRPFSDLYNLMSVKFDKEPRGEGRVVARIESGNLSLTDFSYFNRGVYARGTGTIDNILDPPNSKINAYLVGTFRPLRDLDLPFFADVDKIMSVIQSAATTVYVSGSIVDVKAVPAAFADIGDAFKSVLLGEARKK